VRRPLRCSLAAGVRPYGLWCTISPMNAMAASCKPMRSTYFRIVRSLWKGPIRKVYVKRPKETPAPSRQCYVRVGSIFPQNGYPLHPRKFQGSSCRQGASWSHHGQWLEFVRDPVHSSFYGTKCMVNDRIFAAKWSWFLSLPVRHWYFLATGATGVKGIPHFSAIPNTSHRAQGEQVGRRRLKPYWSKRPAFSFRRRCGAVVAHRMLSAGSWTRRLT
jgi:hypothetical protein